MPRVAGIYSRPTGIDAVANNTIDSGKYNSNVADVEADLNLPRPIVAGGTGASSAAGARDNLDVEVSLQTITNYNTDVFENGSFASAAGATGAPEPSGTYHGTAIVTSQNFILLEAHIINDVVVPGKTYIREKKAGVWGSWTAGNFSDKVSIAGDTMTGDLTINKANPAFALKKTASGQTALLSGFNGVNARWTVALGDTVAEGGTNTGSNFSIVNYNDAGAPIGTAFSLNRATSAAFLSGDLNINKAGPTITLQKTASNQNISILGYTGSSVRWALNLGNSTSEIGSNIGSDFSIASFGDTGTPITTPLSINRASGRTSINNGVDISGGIAAVALVPGASPTLTVGTVIGQNSVQTIGFPGGGTQYGMVMKPAADNTVAINFFNAASASVGNIGLAPASTSYNTSSDERLKEDLQPAVNDASRIIDETLVYNFRWKSTQERAYGVIAQQANLVYPLAITHREPEDTWGVDYSKYVPILLQEAKTLRTRIKALEALIGTSGTILQRLDVLDKFREKIEAL